MGQVVQLWRYPVKSMGGERIPSASLVTGGLAGDRHWAVKERQIRTGKQWPALLKLRARYLREPGADDHGAQVAPVEISSPDGSRCRSDEPRIDAWLSAQLQKSARLAARQPASAREHYLRASAMTEAEINAEIALQPGEAMPSYEAVPTDLLTLLGTYCTPPGFYYDAYPLHFLTTDSLSYLAERSGLDTDVRRFRPNLLVQTDNATAALTEFDWIGRDLAVGEAVLRLESRTIRCTMPSRAQPLFGLGEQKPMTRAIVDHVQRELGVNVRVLQAGRVREGDAVTLLEAK
ncbi:MAG TPA: MOSC N-terminal beta barrel domain-containing protein [Steroidobacteraceae bacterium]|nr:MOSC N-terminal beta barrel domain-containing protein [Steroidobacteraceae bacterium]HQW09608.1 MOSC N-terminal beta barrel domain-containing protein [Steroidobacteraceae bacterium]HQX79045.1 MOSC N-terminal beta barrel domain-containing protein [Steroidobacteraceae bacterium]